MLSIKCYWNLILLWIFKQMVSKNTPHTAHMISAAQLNACMLTTIRFTRDSKMAKSSLLHRGRNHFTNWTALANQSKLTECAIRWMYPVIVTTSNPHFIRLSLSLFLPITKITLTKNFFNSTFQHVFTHTHIRSSNKEVPFRRSKWNVMNQRIRVPVA